MASRTSWLLLAPLVATVLLTGCRFNLEQRDPWRAEEEEKCLAAKAVVASAFMEPMPAVEGPGVCGMEHPFKVTAFSQGNVVVEPAGRLACPVIYQTERWLEDVVQPAALAWLGQPVVAVRQMSAYSCRGMNGNPNAKISEHAFGNALDVGAFRTADGRWITVKDGWKGPASDRGFLLQVQAGACERFTTVLAPGSNVFHYDHIHVDLMRHEKGRTICKPAPRPMPAPMAVKAPPAMAPLYAPSGPEAAAPARMPVAEAPPPPAPAPQPSFFQTLFGPKSAPAPAPEPQPVYMPDAEPPSPPMVSAPMAPVPVASAPMPAAPMPAPSMAAAPRSSGQIVASPAPLPPAAVSTAAPPPGRRAPPQPPQQQGLPPGWQVGPQGVPLSYAPHPPVTETGSVTRKYYTAPMPPPSTIPLPKARPGED